MVIDTAPAVTGTQLGYARVSTSHQSLDQQMDALTRAGVDAVRVYTDKLSGTSTRQQRPGLAALLDYARQGDAIVVVGIDRLGRNAAEVMTTIRDLGERGIVLRSLREGIDTSNASGRALPRVIRHLMKVSNGVFEGINAHVPQSERGIDARDFVPLSGLLAALRHPTTTRDRATTRTRPALHTVPWKQKLTTAARVLLSQTPFHDPAKEPLPEFAHHWFERYDRGDDMSHWYSDHTTS